MDADVALAIDAEAVPVLLVGKGTVSWVDGEAVQTPGASTSVMAAVQPASGRMLMDMPEGVREETTWIFWTRHPVATDEKLVMDQGTFRVTYVQPRPDGGFYRGGLGGIKE